MNHNYIEYSVPCKLSFDKPIELEKGDLKISIKSTLDSIIIRFECYDEVDETEFEAQVASELEKLLDKIVFSYSISVGDPFILSKSISKRKEIYNCMSFKFEVIPRPLTDDQLIRLKEELEQEAIDTTYFRMYRYALKNDNPVDKFMFLYGILLMIYGTQKEVDKFIRTRPEYDSSEDKISGNPRRRDKETIYTWLRNQVGHIKRGTDIGNVRSEMAKRLDSLQNIVKSAIIQTQNKPII